MSKLPVSVDISNIQLDLNNPRHEPFASEQEVIDYLIANEDIRVLAKHIAETGSTSPIDMLAIAPHPKIANSYIAAEGNRRLCALKLLLDPDKASEKTDKTYFEKLKASIKAPINDALCIEFLDLASARAWVELRHDAPAGIGVKKWDATQKTRFNVQGKANNPNAKALEVIEFARAKGLLTEDELSRIPLTTITRFLSTPAVRNSLGISDAKGLLITVPEAEFEIAIKQFLLDAITLQSPVNSRTSADERTAYAEDLRTKGFAPTTRNLKPFHPGAKPVPAVPTPPISPSVKAPPKTRNIRSRDKDECVVPSGFVSKVKDPVFDRIYKELRSLDAEAYTFSATYLFRALVEQSVTLYIQKKKILPVPNVLHLKLRAVADDLTANGVTGKPTNILIKMSSDKDGKYSPDTIGNFIHGGAIPTRVYVIKAWDSFEPALVEILKVIE